MTIDQIRRLIERVLAGDQDALIDLLERAETHFLTTDLAHTPAGVRAEALAGVAALWKARRAWINRQRKMKAENAKRDKGKVEAVAAALEHVDLYVMTITKIAEAIEDWLTVNGRYMDYGLDELPSNDYIKAKIRKARKP